VVYSRDVALERESDAQATSFLALPLSDPRTDLEPQNYQPYSFHQPPPTYCLHPQDTKVAWEEELLFPS